LFFKHLPADGAAVETGRCSCFETAGPKAKSAECLAEEDRGGLTAAAGGITLFAAVDEAVEKRPGGDDGGAGEEVASVAELEAENAAVRAGGARELRREG
jgi:hypothetical protein